MKNTAVCLNTSRKDLTPSKSYFHAVDVDSSDASFGTFSFGNKSFLKLFLDSRVRGSASNFAIFWTSK